MQAGPDSRRASAAALLPIVVVAVSVLLLALLVSGGQRGTIVVERVAEQVSSRANGHLNRAPTILITTVTETKADGELERTLYSDSATQPGFQEVTAGNVMQLYIARTNTIYVTTEASLRSTSIARIKRTAPKGAPVHLEEGYGSLQLIPGVDPDVPGRTSVYAQGLRDHEYRITGRTTIDGHPALKLVRRDVRPLPSLRSAVTVRSLNVAYVSPKDYEPILAINRTILLVFVTTEASRWMTYRVVPATPAHQWLVSLTARHPNARVIHGASAYLRAVQAETLVTTVN